MPQRGLAAHDHYAEDPYNDPYNYTSPYLDEYAGEVDLAAYQQHTHEEPRVWSTGGTVSTDGGAAGTCDAEDGSCDAADALGDGAGGLQGDDPYGPYEEPDHPIDPDYPYDNCVYGETLREWSMNGTDTCNLLVQGVDAHADALQGGLDGVYSLVGCFEGKPAYVRAHSPPQESRVLFYNPHYGDWEFGVGPEPSEDQLLLYGDAGYVSPLDVPRWHLAAALNSDQAKALPAEDEELYYVATGVSITCSDSDTAEEDAALKEAWALQEEEHERNAHYLQTGYEDGYGGEAEDPPEY